MAKYSNHNGKEVKVVEGKNIRVTTEGWLKIRTFCFKNNLKMGAFVESSTLKAMSSTKSKTK